MKDATSKGQVFHSEAPSIGKTMAPISGPWPLNLNPSLREPLQGPPNELAVACPTKNNLASQLMSQEPQHPPIWDKVSAKTRGYLAQAQQHRTKPEQQEKGSNMSAAEQT